MIGFFPRRCLKQLSRLVWVRRGPLILFSLMIVTKLAAAAEPEPAKIDPKAYQQALDRLNQKTEQKRVATTQPTTATAASDSALNTAFEAVMKFVNDEQKHALDMRRRIKELKEAGTTPESTKELAQFNYGQISIHLDALLNALHKLPISQKDPTLRQVVSLTETMQNDIELWHGATEESEVGKLADQKEQRERASVFQRHVLDSFETIVAASAVLEEKIKHPEQAKQLEAKNLEELAKKNRGRRPTGGTSESKQVIAAVTAKDVAERRSNLLSALDNRIAAATELWESLPAKSKGAESSLSIKLRKLREEREHLVKTPDSEIADELTREREQTKQDRLQREEELADRQQQADDLREREAEEKRHLDDRKAKARALFNWTGKLAYCPDCVGGKYQGMVDALGEANTGRRGTVQAPPIDKAEPDENCSTCAGTGFVPLR